MESTILKNWLKKIESSKNKDYFTVKEIASILDVSYNKIIYDITCGYLSAVRVGPRGSKSEIRVHKEDLLKYIKNFEVF